VVQLEKHGWDQEIDPGTMFVPLLPRILADAIPDQDAKAQLEIVE
jgi:hypothetical protein